MINGTQNILVVQRPQVRDVSAAELVRQNTAKDIKHQNIEYYMCDRNRSVESKGHNQVDLFKALSEIKGLDWTFHGNFIGFENNNTNECLQFHRGGKDQWFADVPIRKPKWEGYYWRSATDTKHVLDMVSLFFEEDSAWFDMLAWKMSRTKKPGTRYIDNEDF